MQEMIRVGSDPELVRNLSRVGGDIGQKNDKVIENGMKLHDTDTVSKKEISVKNNH